MLRHDTFEYKTITSDGNGTRGVFDWSFEYHWLPKRPEDLLHPEQPSPLPVMLGCAFAIRRDYFFDLGGYDEKLMIWNGENYELSLKLWLCGGRLLEVPCSRVAHMFRKRNIAREIDDFDYVAHNFKRIAEVWLGDFKQFLYRTEPKRYADADAGDLTRAKMIRKNLNCKPFDYFLEYVMPDMLERYPYKDLGVFANGAIQSESTKLCIDTSHNSYENSIDLNECSSDLVNPIRTQSFSLSWHRQIKPKTVHHRCLDTKRLEIKFCDFKLKRQLWFYDMVSYSCDE